MDVAAGAPVGGTPSGGAPARCGVPLRRSGAMRRPAPTIRGRAMQRDAAFRSDVSARCGVPIRRFGQLPRKLVGIAHREFSAGGPAFGNFLAAQDEYAVLIE